MTERSAIDQLATVVVHHRRYPDVLTTIDALLAQGCDPRAFVVVDNSEDDELYERLAAGLPEDIMLIGVANEGYGPAVNAGLRQLREVDAARDRGLVLVSTHEALPGPEAVERLVQTLERDPSLAAAGPALVMSTAEGLTTWSLGGRLTRFLREPRHHGAGLPPEAIDGRPPRRCDWLDGAFCVYRRQALPVDPFRPDFFMYFEETELHTRLRRSGMTLACVPSAVVEQSSGGAPAFLLARNLQIFQRLHGRLVHRLLTVPAVISRKVVRRIMRGGPPGEIRDLLRGWRSAWR